MNQFQVFGIRTDLIKPGDSLHDHITLAMKHQGLVFKQHDILVLAESAVATSQGRIVALETVKPSLHAQEVAAQYEIDPNLAEIVIRESDSIIGGIPGFLLSITSGHLLPNAGVDGSNAPDGYVTLLPCDTDEWAHDLRKKNSCKYRPFHCSPCHRQQDSSDAIWVWRCCNRLFRHPCCYR